MNKCHHNTSAQMDGGKNKDYHKTGRVVINIKISLLLNSGIHPYMVYAYVG